MTWIAYTQCSFWFLFSTIDFHHSLCFEAMSSNSFIFLSLVGFRIFDGLFVRTYFNPDEFWQSMEVAHNRAFGFVSIAKDLCCFEAFVTINKLNKKITSYGHLTWEWKDAIRGYTHPFIFTILYQILKVLEIDSAELVVKKKKTENWFSQAHFFGFLRFKQWSPRILQSIFAAVADFYLYKLTYRLFGKSAAKWAVKRKHLLNSKHQFKWFHSKTINS